jgi:hypothetical protein
VCPMQLSLSALDTAQVRARGQDDRTCARPPEARADYRISTGLGRSRQIPLGYMGDAETHRDRGACRPVRRG